MATQTLADPVLIRGVHVFSPDDLGKKDIFMAGGRILAMAEQLHTADFAGLVPELIDGHGFRAIPGLVDSLTHIAGGGGEDGFASRTPPMPVEHAVRAGVTSLVACLGTDAITRHHSDLLAHARLFRAHGLSTWCYTGSYEVPVRTLTGSIQSDLVWIKECIGVGEIALGEHRGAQPTVTELARLASEARRAGLLAGKAGIVSIHLGDDPSAFDLLEHVTAKTPLPRRQFYPTHVNRTAEVFAASIAHAKRGGLTDITTSTTPALLAMGEVPAARAVAELLAQGVAIEQISMSSDAQASLPAFDTSGRLSGLEMADMRTLWQAVRTGVQQYKVPFSTMLATVTRTPADILGFASKGRLAVGLDADLLLVKEDDLSLDTVFAQGHALMSNAEVGELKRVDRPSTA
jgi:beta-aspartyl-dipeptidase (metallo-type)